MATPEGQKLGAKDIGEADRDQGEEHHAPQEAQLNHGPGPRDPAVGGPDPARRQAPR